MFLSLPVYAKPEAFEMLRQLVKSPQSPNALVNGMLAIVKQVAAKNYPMDVVAELDSHAQAIRRRLKSNHPQALLAHMHAYLFDVDELGFSGNAVDLSKPIHYFLPWVLEHKVGSPILLAVIYREIARRLGFQVEGIPLPGHFNVKLDLDNKDLFIDPSLGGKEVVIEEIDVEPVSNAQWWTRVMQSLIAIYHARENFEVIAALLEMEIMIWPDTHRLKRDLGLLYARMGDKQNAVICLKYYKEQNPQDDPTIGEIKELIKTLQS